MRIFLFAIALITLFTTRVRAADSSSVQTEPPAFAAFIRTDLEVDRTFARVGATQFGIFAFAAPSLNYVNGITPTALVGVTLRYHSIQVGLGGGLVINNPPHLVEPLIGVRFQAHIGLPRTHDSRESGRLAHAASHTHLNLAASALFDPQYGWTETELDATATIVPRVAPGIKGFIEGYLSNPKLMQFQVGPATEFTLVGRAHQSSNLRLDAAYLLGSCEDRFCHGPFLRLTYQQL